jgi:hypothetical protein
MTRSAKSFEARVGLARVAQAQVREVRTGLSKTDIVSRAISLHKFADTDLPGLGRQIIGDPTAPAESKTLSKFYDIRHY